MSILNEIQKSGMKVCTVIAEYDGVFIEIDLTGINTAVRKYARISQPEDIAGLKESIQIQTGLEARLKEHK